MQVKFKQLVVEPGHPFKMENVSWEMYEGILKELDQELGHERKTRVNYGKGILEIMAPLPEHEIDKVIISDLVKVILEELDIEFISLGSTTFKNQEMLVAVEADDCFYIKNEALMRGKNRINLMFDPPPELAIKIDITARTRLNNYEALGVLELWRFDGKKLQINILQNGQYLESKISPSLNGLELTEIIPEYLEMSRLIGRNAAIKKFRAWLRKA